MNEKITYTTNDNYEIQHYGVLGMKWGIRRSRKQLEAAAAARAKGNTKQAKELEKKSKQTLQKHISRTSKATVDRVSNTSTGKLVAESLLAGTYGALVYNQMRSDKKNSRLSAIGGAIVANAANTLTSGLLSIIQPRAKSGELDNFVKRK